MIKPQGTILEQQIESTIQRNNYLINALEIFIII